MMFRKSFFTLSRMKVFHTTRLIIPSEFTWILSICLFESLRFFKAHRVVVVSESVVSCLCVCVREREREREGYLFIRSTRVQNIIIRVVNK